MRLQHGTVLSSSAAALYLLAVAVVAVWWTEPSTFTASAFVVVTLSSPNNCNHGTGSTQQARYRYAPLHAFSTKERSKTSPTTLTTTISSSSSLRATTNDDDDDDDDFVNDGPLAWMRPYLTVFGMTEGKTLNFALPFDLDDDSKNFNSDEQAAAAAAARLREEAARTLTNIGAEERERRGQAATVFAVLTAMYAVWSSLIADDGGLAGHLIRFGIVLPLFFTFGYKLSEETGL
jgi:hypothetical protein